MNISWAITSIIILIIIVVELSQDRALMHGRTFFPKKNDDPFRFKVLLVVKIVLFLMCAYYTFTVPN